MISRESFPPPPLMSDGESMAGRRVQWSNATVHDHINNLAIIIIALIMMNFIYCDLRCYEKYCYTGSKLIIKYVRKKKSLAV